MNKVILLGNLTRDVEVKEYANTTVARAGIAVNRPFKNKEVDFFNLVAFNKTAEFLGKWFSKGSKILVEGRVQIEQYEDKEGLKRTAVNVIVNEVEFADSKKKDSGNAKRGADDDFFPPPDLEDTPF